MQTSSDIAVIPRDIDFRTESACEAAWLGGDPVATAPRVPASAGANADAGGSDRAHTEPES